MTISVKAIDHLVLTTADLPRCIEFYTRVLGMQKLEYGSGRIALTFGEQKINVHPRDSEIMPLPAAPTPGAIDLCLLSGVPLHEVLEHFRLHGVEVIEGPVARNGARFPLLSVYIRDPDGNLIEVSEPARFD